MDAETRALALSAIAALALGVPALVVAFASGSAAVLLDSAFNLCFFATALVTLRVARQLRRPDDDRYPFGYLQFEPLINLVKALLILGVGLFALADSGLAIRRGGTEVAAGPALAYAAYATVHCAVVLWALRRAGRRAASPLVVADVGNWAVNLAISAGMTVAFVLAVVFQQAAMPAAAMLVDPVLVSLVVLLTLPVPVRMCRGALLALLQRAPAPEVVGAVEAAVRRALGELPVRGVFVRVVQPGRTTYALVHVLLGDEATGLDMRDADRLRRAVGEAVAAACGRSITDVVFTADPALAAPTTGLEPER
jgi:cation diffusion facilitator family transporter